MKFIMHLTIQNIKRRRVRTILTLLGVMIGVVAVVSLLSLGMGVKRELLQGYGDDASIRQITVQTPENNQNKKMLLTDHTIEKLAKLDKVANVYPRYEVFTNIQVGQYTAYTNLVGIPSEQLSAIALTDTSSLSEHARKCAGLHVLPRRIYDQLPRRKRRPERMDWREGEGFTGT